MLPYFAVWTVAALAALSPLRLQRFAEGLLFLAAGIFLVLFIGLRYEVGADWYNYLTINQLIVNAPGLTYLVISDPAYAVAARLVGDMANAVYLINSLCAALFVAGSLRFCRDQPLPSLALCITVSYLVVVVAMGYTRQSAAIGLLMWGLADLRRRRAAAFAVAVIAASLFHRSALVALPLTLIAVEPKRRGQVALLLAIAIPAFVAVFFASISSQFSLYSSGEIQSDGGAVRAVMNAVPALIFLLYRRRFRTAWPDDAALWLWPSLLALLLLPLLPVASTAADRIGLYLVPLQIAVLSRVPLLLRGQWRAAIYLGVIVAYGCVLTFWLETSFFARCCWIPYRWVL